MSTPARSLFSAFGLELEYMLVDRQSLDVRPLCAELLRDPSGDWVDEHPSGDCVWSNELAAHVVEIKLDEPASTLAGLGSRLAQQVQAINARLAAWDARLLPSAMHPWMDPARETQLWPHGNRQVYEAFDRIFGCRGHGWSNLQSAHLNLPFADDAEFARLHAAIRFLLPLLPALAASSPLAEGRPTGWLDYRLHVYAHNCGRIPEVTGRVVPERAVSQADYQQQILTPMYQAIAPCDPQGTLQHEWLNARGAIARFDRGSIEIRVLDVQECPSADVALAAAVVAVLRWLVDERGPSFQQQLAWPLEPLAELFQAVARQGEQAVVTDQDYLHTCSLRARRATAGELWAHLLENVSAAALAEHRTAWQVLLEQGPLARRILRAVGPAPSRERLREVYSQLADCLADNRSFAPAL